MALVARAQTRQAEARHRPAGQFLTVDGVKLHYIARGEGEPLLLLHGNGTQIEDLEVSGLIDLAARRHRVIAFDRPGFGHSERPSGRVWTAAAQADLICEALHHLGIERCVALGHSWGASVAVALGLNHPAAVAGLVLASGYYYPTDRFDSALQIVPAAPVVGGLLRQTLLPLLARLGWSGMVKTLFAPLPPPPAFSAAIREMALRPSQLRAAAVEASLLVPIAIATQERYGELAMPVCIIVGDSDRVIKPQSQSVRLHRDIPQSTLRVVPDGGHMVHHGAPEDVLDAIRAVERGAEAITAAAPAASRGASAAAAADRAAAAPL